MRTSLRTGSCVPAPRQPVCLVTTLVTACLGNYANQRHASRFAGNHWKPLWKPQSCKPAVCCYSASANAVFRIPWAKNARFHGYHALDTGLDTSATHVLGGERGKRCDRHDQEQENPARGRVWWVRWCWLPAPLWQALPTNQTARQVVASARAVVVRCPAAAPGAAQRGACG